MRTSLGLAVVALCACSGAANAGVVPNRATLNSILGGGQVLEDFESYSVATGTAEGLGVFSLDNTTVANGQGPGLVEPGATYLDPGQINLQWDGDQYFGLDTKTLLASGNDGTLVITYGAPVRAMGVDLLGFQGFGWSGQMDVYGPGNVLLGTVPATINSGGSERVFAGWEDAGGIDRVEIQSSDYVWSPIIDDHGYGNPGGARRLYATNNLAAANGYTSGGDQLITFDPGNPAGWLAVGEIIDSGVPVAGLGGLDFDANGGLWAADSFGASPGAIYRVNPATAQATYVGNAPVAMHDLAWNPVRNDLFGTDSLGNLWANVDDPPNAQFVGTYNIPTPLEVGIAFDSRGNLYVHDLVNDGIYRAPANNLTNTTLMYTLPYDSNFSQGLFVDWSGADRGFHGAFNNSAFASEVYNFFIDGSGYGPLLGTFPTDGGTGLPEVETGDLTAAPVMDAREVYATNNLAGTNGYTQGGDQLIVFDPTNPAGWMAVGEIVDIVTGAPLNGFGGLDFDRNGRLWAADSFGANPGAIYIINRNNARAAFIGVAPASMADLAWNPQRNDLFGTDAAGNLWANVDDPPNAFIVGNYGIGSLEVGIAWDSRGNLFMHDLVSDAIYRGPAANPTAVALMYNLPFDSNFSQGLFVDWSDGDTGLHGALNNTLLTSETWAFDVTGAGYGPQLGTFPTDGGTGLPEVETGDLASLPTLPPCPADYNNDGTVNSQDFVAFLNDFVAGNLRADYNGDGTVNSQDFVAFLNDFVAGC
jgi:hypothetical protein